MTNRPFQPPTCKYLRGKFLQMESKIPSGTQQVRPKKHNKLWKICLHNEPNTAHNFCEIFMITLWSFCLYIAWQGAKQAIHDLWIFYAFIIFRWQQTSSVPKTCSRQRKTNINYVKDMFKINFLLEFRVRDSE